MAQVAQEQQEGVAMAQDSRAVAMALAKEVQGYWEARMGVQREEQLSNKAENRSDGVLLGATRYGSKSAS